MWEETGAPHPEMDTNARGIAAKGIDDSQCVGSNYKNRRREGLTGQPTQQTEHEKQFDGGSYLAVPAKFEPILQSHHRCGSPHPKVGLAEPQQMH